MAKPTKSPSIKRTSETDRYVVPNKSGGWDIVKEGHRRATGHAMKKQEAIVHALKIVRNEGGGELRIVNRYGKLTDSDTIPPSRRRK